jgi:hypothetical protein
MNRATEREQADYLLVEWYEWESQWGPKLGAPRVAPYCQQSVSSRQWESSTDASCGRLHVVRMKAVDFCVSKLPTPLRGAIGLEMRNRQVNARVWRQPAGGTFEEAIVALMPILAKAGLFE